MLRLSFGEFVRKCEHKTIGNDPAIAIQCCRKNYTKDGAEPTFTWINITIFKAPPWMSEKARAGAFIYGSGEFTLRSYEKDGQKRQSADIRCSSFEVDFVDAKDKGDAATVAAPVHARAPVAAGSRTPASAGNDDEPPFAKYVGGDA
jgi:hypothetical protein